MALIEHAERELRDAGLFDKDSDYDGMLGNAVMELVKVFAAQGHSGFSAAQTRTLFNIVVGYGLLTPLKNPMETGEYTDHTDISGGKPCFQSTRKSSVFSMDGGKTWYDLDGKVPRWKRMLGIRRAYLKFLAAGRVEFVTSLASGNFLVGPHPASSMGMRE